MLNRLSELRFVITHFFSYLVPRKRNLWVFIGWHTTKDDEIFTDNTKYLYLHIHHNEKTIDAIWLAKSRTMATKLQQAGFRAYYESSLLGIWYALQADVTVIDAYLQRWNYAFLGSSRLVQLLHGKGMKAKGYSRASRHPHDDICYPSETVANMIGDEFKTGSTKHITGYPRSDVIIGKRLPGYEIHVDQKTLNLLSALKKSEAKLLWYTPTFRRNKTSFDLDTVLDAKTLIPTLEQHNLHLCISLHPKYFNDQSGVKSDRVHFLPPQDFFPLYHYFDIVITDYSSTFTDFLLLNRPIIFYPYDLDEYLKEEGIVIDYQSETPGPKAYTAEDLRDQIISTLEHDSYQQERQVALQRYHQFTDDQNAERVMEALETSK